jgi:hypothetical protein
MMQVPGVPNDAGRKHGGSAGAASSKQAGEVAFRISQKSEDLMKQLITMFAPRGLLRRDHVRAELNFHLHTVTSLTMPLSQVLPSTEMSVR